MSDEQILDGIRDVMRRHLRLDVPLRPETDVLRDLCLDSVQRLTLIVELENRFRICFEPGDAEGVSTLGDVTTLIRDRLEAGDDADA